MTLAVAAPTRSRAEVAAWAYVAAWVVGLGTTGDLQRVLVHGVAGALLLAVALLVRHGRAWGVTAAVLSLVQLAVGLTVDGPGAVDRLDGVKILALAAFVVTARRTRLSEATAAALVVTAVGFLANVDALEAVAFVSLPLLLASVVSAARR